MTISRRPSNVSIVAGAVGLSALGDFFALIPLALHLEESTGSGLAVAGLFIALWSPAILLAGPAGLLADRVDPRRVLIGMSLLQAAVAIVLAFAGGGGTLAVLGLAALLGAGSAFSAPAEFALLPRVAGDDVGRANARVETARYAGFAAGPMLGGVLAAGGGIELALLVDAATFGIVALAGAVLPAAAREATGSVSESAKRGRARDGAAFLLRDGVLRAVLPVALVALLIMTATVTAEVFFAKDVLGTSDIGYGAMTTAWMIGMVVGATTMRVGAKPIPIFCAIGAQGLGLAMPALWPLLAFTLISYLGGGIAHGIKNVLLRTLIHERTPEHLHGRAFAAYNGLRNGAELVALTCGGLLVAGIGARWTLLVAGGVPVLVALAALLRTATLAGRTTRRSPAVPWRSARAASR